MRKLPLIALVGSAILATAGTAAVASNNSHVMDFPLPDGSVARVQYVGDVAPKVTIEPATLKADGDWVPMPSFAGFDRMIARMDQETEAMIRQAEQMEHQPLAERAAPYVASLKNAPQGASSMTVVSFSNGSGSCTRTTEAVSEGEGRPLKVTSKISGNCSKEGTLQPPLNSPPTSHT